MTGAELTRFWNLALSVQWDGEDGPPGALDAVERALLGAHGVLLSDASDDELRMEAGRRRARNRDAVSAALGLPAPHEDEEAAVVAELAALRGELSQITGRIAGRRRAARLGKDRLKAIGQIAVAARWRGVDTLRGKVIDAVVARGPIRPRDVARIVFGEGYTPMNLRDVGAACQRAHAEGLLSRPRRGTYARGVGEVVVRAVGCPFCGAAPGDLCRGPSGPSHNIHAARAVAAYGDPAVRVGDE